VDYFPGESSITIWQDDEFSNHIGNMRGNITDELEHPNTVRHKVRFRHGLSWKSLCNMKCRKHKRVSIILRIHECDGNRISLINRERVWLKTVYFLAIEKTSLGKVFW